MRTKTMLKYLSLILLFPSIAFAAYLGKPVKTKSGGTQTDSSSATGVAHVASGTWTYGAVDLSGSDVTNNLPPTKFPAFSSVYTAFVGGSSIPGFNVYASINAAIADTGNFPAGSKALIVANQTISTVQVISTANVEFDCLPGVVLTGSGSVNGIQVSAARVRLHGCKMTGFTGGSNEAILIDSGSNYTSIWEFYFGTNTSDIVDNNGKTSVVGVINE